MHLLKNLSAICIAAIFLLPACSEEDEFSPYLEGDIIGYAYCFDEFGNEPEDFSGITVVTEPGRKYSAVTDADGRYVLKGVINGTYNLSYEKEGFGTMKLQGIRHLGGSPTMMEKYAPGYAPFVYQFISSEITGLEISNDTLRANFNTSDPYKPYFFFLRLFFSREENFSIESVEAIRNIRADELFDSYKKSVSSEINSLPFESGETVYFKACIFTEKLNALFIYNNKYVSGIETYYDFDTNTTIYPNLSHESDEFSFIMP